MQGETDSKAISQAIAPDYKDSWADRTLIDRFGSEIPSLFGNASGQEKRYVRDAGEYRDKLRAVIQASRQLVRLDDGSVPWVIAKTSYILGGVTSQPVLDGQNASQLGLDDVYQGPSSDDLGNAYRRSAGERADERVHFN